MESKILALLWSKRSSHSLSCAVEVYSVMIYPVLLFSKQNEVAEHWVGFFSSV